ncbi:O-antigen ligase family protein [Polaribacter sp. M15]
MLLIASWKFKEINVVQNLFYKKIILAILFLSFSLYLSRTMIVSLIILLLAVFGYIKITSKAIKYATIVIVFFGLFYVYLFNANIKRGQSGFHSFLYKMKNAPTEIFSPPKSLDVENHAKLWDRWRAYEAGMAISQIDTFTDFLFGKGLGALVDLKFEAPLGDENIRYIPILHNGYINIFFKSGILGVLLYLMLLLLLYLYANIKTKNTQKKITYNLIGGLAIHYLFTTLIVTGMYNLREFYVLILGALLHYSIEEKKSK